MIMMDDPQSIRVLDPDPLEAGRHFDLLQFCDPRTCNMFPGLLHDVRQSSQGPRMQVWHTYPGASCITWKSVLDRSAGATVTWCKQTGDVGCRQTGTTADNLLCDARRGSKQSLCDVGVKLQGWRQTVWSHEATATWSLYWWDSLRGNQGAGRMDKDKKGAGRMREI